MAQVTLRHVLEGLSQALDDGLLSGFGLLAALFGLGALDLQGVADIGGFQLLAASLDGVVERLQGVGHLADLVLAALLGQLDREIAGGQAAQSGGDLDQRGDQTLLGGDHQDGGEGGGG